MRGILLTLAVAGGCNAVLGVEELPRGLCTTCVQVSCARQKQDCDLDDGCRLLAQCREACPLDDILCRRECAEQHPRASDSEVWVRFDACIRDDCLDDCLGSRWAATFVDEDCAACLDETCSILLRACIASATCEEQAACVDANACDDPQCILKCIADSGTADPAAGAWRGCAMQCEHRCPFGGAWDCVEKDFVWPPPEAPDEPIATQWLVHDALFGGESVEGVAVSACTEAGCDPASYVAAEYVDILLPTSRKGFHGFLKLEGPNAAGDAFITSYHYVGNPISFPGPRGDMGIMSPSNVASLQAQIPAIDPDQAYFSAYIADCYFNHARGIVFDVDEERQTAETGTFFMVSRGTVSVTMKATNGAAIGGMFNLTGGAATIVARDVESDQVVAEADVTLREGEWVHVTMAPNGLD